MSHQNWQRRIGCLAAACAIMLGGAATAQSLGITASDTTIGAGEKLEVTVGLQGGSVAGVAAQLVLNYDASRLALDFDATAGTYHALVQSSALDLPIYERADTLAGSYVLALGTTAGTGNVTLAGGFVTLRFTCPVDIDGIAGLVSFGSSGRFSSLVSNAAQQAVSLGAPVNLGAITRIGSQPSLVSVPPTAMWWSDADGSARATVSVVPPTATDALGHAATVTYARTDAAQDLTNFPAGSTTIAWTATDSCGNARTAATTVDVSADSVAVVSLAMGGVFGTSSFTRGIAVDFGKGGTAADSDLQTVTMTQDSSGGQYRAATGARFRLAGNVNWSGGCASMRDPLHTLRRAIPVATGGGAGTFGGRTYASSYAVDGGESARWLLVGNANGDANIDILDFATFVNQRGSALPIGTTAATTGPHTDFSANGLVTNADLTFLTANFFTSDEVCNGFTTGGRPIRRISVQTLRRMGMGELAGGDLNGDAWVDERDLTIALQGGSARRPAGAPDQTLPTAE